MTTTMTVIGSIAVVAGALTHIPHVLARLIRATIPLVNAARELHAALTRPTELRRDVAD